MRRFPRLMPLGVAMVLLAGSASAQAAKLERPPRVGTDSVITAADSSHAGGPVHRFFFGSGYRDLWVKPIKVPVLDLGRFDGGLRPTESGGGQQIIERQLTYTQPIADRFRGHEKPPGDYTVLLALATYLLVTVSCMPGDR